MVDGNDIEAMAKTTLEAANRARSGQGPTFIEAQTYRFRGHSMSDPMKYRSKEEAEKRHSAQKVKQLTTVAMAQPAREP